MKKFKDSNGGVHAYDDIQIAAMVRAEHERKAIEAANEAAFQQAIDDAKAAAKIEADAKAIELTEASEQALVDAEARHAEKAQKLADALAAAEAVNVEELAEDEQAEAAALITKLEAAIAGLPEQLVEELTTIKDALPESIAQAANQIESEAVDAAIKNFKPLEIVTFNEDAIQLEITSKMAEYIGDKVEMSEAEYDAFINPKPTLSQLKDEKRAEIKQAYLDASDATVTLNAIVWDGGFESAIKLDAAMRLSEAAGADGVIFYDSDNVSHALNFDDALDVCIGVAVAYQTALGIKQKLYSDIEKATTVAAVNKIKWPTNA